MGSDKHVDNKMKTDSSVEALFSEAQANEVMNHEDKYEEALKDLCRNGSMSRLKAHSKTDYLVVSDWPAHLTEYKDTGEWLSVIFVKSTAIKVLFKAHYHAKEIRQWVCRAQGIDIQDVTNEKCQDFIKEFCNLSAGLLKNAFEQTDSRISLPLITRGSDEMFFSCDYQGGKQIFEHKWVIGDLESQVFCSAEIEVYDSQSLEKLLLTSFGGGSDNGDVEFF